MNTELMFSSATANKIPVNTTTLTAWANAVVASLNAIPAPTEAPAETAAA